jgi:hypothetical protein
VEAHKKKFPIALIGAAAVVLLVLSFCDRRNGSGVRRMVHLPPFIRLDVGQRDTWMVRRGINIVRDNGKGPAGNIVEFPILPGYRMGITYFSRRWWQEEHVR